MTKLFGVLFIFTAIWAPAYLHHYAKELLESLLLHGKLTSSTQWWEFPLAVTTGVLVMLLLIAGIVLMRYNPNKPLGGSHEHH